jgi:hypothetical protein
MTIDPQPRRVRVATSCTREQVQEIRVRTGESLAVGHRNQQHAAFVWCATEDGHHGWVPEDYIEKTGERSAVALRDYDSTHLTVSAGEVLDVLAQIDDYLHCRSTTGVEGWVPTACVHELDVER